MFYKKIKAHEGTLVFKKGKVIKTFSKDYYLYNMLFARKGEGYFLSKYRHSCFVELLNWDKKSVTLVDSGESIGNRYCITNRNMNAKDFLTWLDILEETLDKYKLQHRDINPTNIVYSEETGFCKLIDFNWAIEEGDREDTPVILNPYADNDKHAISKLRKETCGW